MYILGTLLAITLPLQLPFSNTKLVQVTNWNFHVVLQTPHRPPFALSTFITFIIINKANSDTITTYLVFKDKTAEYKDIQTPQHSPHMDLSLVHASTINYHKMSHKGFVILF